MAELREEDLVDYDFDEAASVASIVSVDIQTEPSTRSSDVAGAPAPSSANRSATENVGLGDIPVPRVPVAAAAPSSSGAAGMDIQPAVVQGQPQRDDRCSRVYVADVRRTYPAPCE